MFTPFRLISVQSGAKKDVGKDFQIQSLDHFIDSILNWKLDVAVAASWSYGVMELWSRVRGIKIFYFRLLFIDSLKLSCQVLLCSENS